MEEQKKRGRKKKDLQATATQATATQPKIEEPDKQEPQEETEPKKVSKRGRKVKVVDFKKNENVQLNKFELEEAIILHLPINLNTLLEDIPSNMSLNDINESIMRQQPRVPIPYNAPLNSQKNEPLLMHTDNRQINPRPDTKAYKQALPQPSTYKSVENNGDIKTTIVYNDTVLPTTKDFTNVKQVMTEKTNVACWWCCHQFDTHPVCAPIKYNEHKDLFTVVGCFCSFNCAKAYAMKDMKNNSSIALNSFLYKRVTGQLAHIKPAPSKTVLKMFGGPLSITEYRETFTSLSSIQLNVYPMVFVPTQVEYNKVESSFQKYRASVNKGVLTKSSVDIATKRLSTSKSKAASASTSKKVENNLFNVMGITIKQN